MPTTRKTTIPALDLEAVPPDQILAAAEQLAATISGEGREQTAEEAAWIKLAAAAYQRRGGAAG